MTPEQLDEIEKLAEAATPGPWKFQRRNGVWAYAREDLVFMEAMREHALPLVKALREALTRCDTLRGLADEKAYESGLYARRMEQAQQARAEARAEAERLRQKIKELA